MIDDKTLQVEISSSEMKKKIKKDKINGTVITVIIIILLSIIALAQVFPFYLQLVTSLQPVENFYPEYGKIYFIPVEFCFVNYGQAFIEGELLEGIKNTLIVAFGFIFLSSIIILLMGYVLAKKKFKGRNIVVWALLITMMVPGEILMVTNYQLVSSLGWTSTYAGLILPGIVNVTGIFLVKAFMDSIPDACLESAKLDGANELKILISIVLPLCFPVISTYIVLNFVAQWNDYLWPMLITGDSAMFTIQLKLYNFAGSTDWGETVYKAASLIISLIPVLIVYFCCQKKFIGGLNFSGIK